ncbi:glycosyltransferase family 1 protein [Selenomonas sp. AE3005]|uniref:glycosyltransferase family 1 protein n=1 Tax=Selenomonas sp. AE3005 TaxID=1485543 RepID=UPI00055BF8BA|nr:glycosyltransferase family 1 protein [Selenomonas sp. AE3005]
MDKQKPIRVLQIIGIVCGGGVEAVIMNYYRNIDRTKVQFDFVIDGYERSLLDKEIESLGGRVYHVEPYKKNILRYMSQIYHIVKGGQYSIVHSNMNTLSIFSLFPAWLAGARLRILHNHSTAVQIEGMRTLMKYILRPFAPLFANHYVACSEIAGKWMYGERAMTSGKVVVFKNAIDVEKYSFDIQKRSKLRESIGLTSEQKVIGHVGRFVFQKNHSFLLDVFAEIARHDDKAVLILIGDGELCCEMKSKAGRLGILDKVKFLGLRANVADLYNVMDVFVLPSWYEGLPVVSVEAQANGLPCVISDKVSIECCLTTSVRFMSLEAGVKCWSEAIVDMSCERNNRSVEQLRENCFDISSEGRKLLDWYRGIKESLG